jgi:hypothetical protein
MREDDYDNLLWKRIEKFSFFYPIGQIRGVNKSLKETILSLWICTIIWFALILFCLLKNFISNNDLDLVIIFAIGSVIFLISLIFTIFILFEKCRFIAEIYEEWIRMWDDTRTYEELKEVKIYQYSENWNEHIKLIYTEFDDRILTKTYLWNPKMDEFLGKIQGALLNRWINCEKISDIKDIDISDEKEYKAHFWFLNVWKLLSRKEKLHRIKNILKFVFVYLIFAVMFLIASIMWGWDDDNISFDEMRAGENILERFNFWIIFVLVLLAILVIFLTINFILSVKKFYARIENNTVYIHNWYWWKWVLSSDNYVLSKIKVNYWFITEWNVEWIMLTINDWGSNSIYKRPRNEQTERFCSELSDVIKKYRKL